MGRHVWFRTPTKLDRLDILDLYIGKVSHHEDLDWPQRRDEIARITNGYSPAMIEQVTSMSLTIAHHWAVTASTGAISSSRSRPSSPAPPSASSTPC